MQSMPVLQDLLQRWGFVQLRRYGLELTSDDRILATRPAVLNNGTGGRIVGWRDGDVAIWKLSDWAVPPSAMVAASNPEVVPAVPASPVVAPAPAAQSAGVMAVEVAAEPTVDEDDWEWTIALARARVAVDETELAVPPTPAPRLDPSRTARAEARLPERPTPRAASVRDSAASSEWPKTDLIGSIDYDDSSRVSVRPAVEIPRAEPPATVAIPRNAAPNTVIPVPVLPTMATMTAGCTRMEPVVRTAQISSASASRLAKGTGPVDPPATQRLPAVLVEDTIPDLSVGDRTRPGVPIPRPAEPAQSSTGDRTKPGIALPPASRSVELPSIKRRMLPR